MAKKYLNSIALQNFKAFPEYENLNLEGKHSIIWGVNGSGKSSLFWAIYTFLHSAGKQGDEYKKYFSEGDQSLRNIYGDSPSFLQFSLAEKNENGSIKADTLENFRLAVDEDDSKKELIRSYYQSSEFISHRLLLNFSNFRNSEEINLWPFFERDILPYFSYRGKTLFDILKEFKEKRNSETVANLNKLKDDFNNGLQDLLQPLIRIEEGKALNVLTTYYNENLAEVGEFAQFDIFNPSLLDYTGIKSKRAIIDPVITLKAKIGHSDQDLKDIPKPHIFFNEARINGIALSIRFVLMEYRTNREQNNLLCLDDLLISLDMHNRMKVINLLLSKYSVDYQILLFTHEKGFFNEFQRAIKKHEKDWKVFILRETPIGENPRVEEKGVQTYFDHAQNYFDKEEYEACALFLRKESERILAKVFDPSLDFVWKSELLLTLQDYIGRARGEDKQDISDLKKAVINSYLTDAELNGIFNTRIAALGDSIDDRKLKSNISFVRNAIQKLRTRVVEKDKLKVNLDAIEGIAGRSLNPGAHFNEEPLFKDEMKDALRIVSELKAAVK